MCPRVLAGCGPPCIRGFKTESFHWAVILMPSKRLLLSKSGFILCTVHTHNQTALFLTWLWWLLCLFVFCMSDRDESCISGLFHQNLKSVGIKINISCGRFLKEWGSQLRKGDSPGQRSRSHVRDSVAVQAYPHERILFWLPWPQVTLHGDQSLHSSSSYSVNE